MNVILKNTRENIAIVLKLCPFHFLKLLAIKTVDYNLEIVKQEAILISNEVVSAWMDEIRPLSIQPFSVHSALGSLRDATFPTLKDSVIFTDSFRNTLDINIFVFLCEF